MEVMTVKSFDETGTEYGPHFYADAGLCRRRAYLSKLRKQQFAEEDALADEDEMPKSVGKVFHGVAGSYHSGQATDLLWPSSGSADEAVTEGLRLFKEYKSRFSSDFFGAVKSTELAFPDGATQAKAIQEYFGVPLTGRTDMLVDMNQDDVIRLTAMGMQYLRPGFWLVDHKTTKKRPSNKEAVFGSSYIYSLQAATYIVAFRVLGLDVQGFIANVIVSHKKMTEESFAQIVRPYLPGRDEQMVKHHVQRVWSAWSKEEAEGKPHEANPSACHLYFKACPFLNNPCEQY